MSVRRKKKVKTTATTQAKTVEKLNITPVNGIGIVTTPEIPSEIGKIHIYDKDKIITGKSSDFVGVSISELVGFNNSGPFEITSEMGKFNSLSINYTDSEKDLYYTKKKLDITNPMTYSSGIYTYTDVNTGLVLAEYTPQQLTEDDINEALNEFSNLYMPTAEEQALINELKDSNSAFYEEVCKKAGVTPRSTYADKFCEYLIEHQHFYEWMSISDKKINTKQLLDFKNRWIAHRGTGLADDPDTAFVEAYNNKESDDLKHNCDLAFKKLQEAERVLQQYEVELNTYRSYRGNTSMQKDDYTISANDLLNKLDELKEKIELQKEKIKQLTAEYKQTVKKYEEYEDIAKRKADAIKWWFKHLKDVIKNTEAPQNAQLAKTYEELKKASSETFVLLATEANKRSKLKYEDFVYGFKKQIPGVINEAAAITLEVIKDYQKITSLKNDLSEEDLEIMSRVIPDATKQFSMGDVSNSLALAKSTVNLYNSKEERQELLDMLERASKAALNKLTTATQNRLSDLIIAMADPTPFTNIITDVETQLAKRIPTAQQVLKQVIEERDKDTGMNNSRKEAEEDANNKIKDCQKQIDEYTTNINIKYGDQLTKFNNALTDILGVANQSPDWYIDNLNLLEKKYEKIIIDTLNDSTQTVLDYKFYIRDLAVDNIVNSTIVPMTDAMKYAAVEAIRVADNIALRLEAEVNVLKAQATMKLLGLFGK